MLRDEDGRLLTASRTFSRTLFLFVMVERKMLLAVLWKLSPRCDSCVGPTKIVVLTA
jgi:hypothetical protein